MELLLDSSRRFCPPVSNLCLPSPRGTGLTHISHIQPCRPILGLVGAEQGLSWACRGPILTPLRWGKKGLDEPQDSDAWKTPIERVPTSLLAFIKVSGRSQQDPVPPCPTQWVFGFLLHIQENRKLLSSSHTSLSPSGSGSWAGLRPAGSLTPEACKSAASSWGLQPCSPSIVPNEQQCSCG